MYQVGDTVVYGASGVMRIVDIRDESFAGATRTYYVLSGAASNLNSHTFVPIDNEQLTALMRPLTSRAEIDRIIKNPDDYPEPEWVPETRARGERYKAILESGDRGAIIAMIRAIRKTGKRRIEEGKKNYLSDENVMNKALKILGTEFSIVLDIPEPDAIALIYAECDK